MKCTRTRTRTPFIAATLLICIAATTVAQTMWRMPEVGREWWLARTDNERSFFVIGYTLSSHIWAETLYQADQRNPTDEMSDDYYVAYYSLGPIASYPWDRVVPAITHYYNTNPHSQLTVWQVIHTLFTTINANQTTRRNF